MTKETLRRWCPNKLHQWYADTKYFLRFKLHPQGLASEMFHGILGYEMNWENPRDINEKINWMKFNYDTSEWSRLADKLLVREYVKERIGEKVLPSIYGCWERAEDINFEKLPAKFVFKTNQGCGTVMPVNNKASLNIEETISILNKWVMMKFGYKTIEPHYLKIKPFIYAEEYLEDDTNFSNSLVDYKVFCLSGKPYCVLVCTNRIMGSHPDLSFYDCSWNYMSDILPNDHSGGNSNIPKPKCLDILLEYSRKLSKGHPQVRIDFYIVKGRIYFGEMTFTSQGGYMDYISREYSLKMGELVKLPTI